MSRLFASTDYIQSPSSAIYDSVGGRGSISFWFKTTQTNGSNQPQPILMRQSGTAGNLVAHGVEIYLNAPGYSINASMANSGVSSQVQTNAGGFNDGQWHHVLVNWNQTSGQPVDIFVDGRINGVNSQATLSSSWTWGTTLPVTMGANVALFSQQNYVGNIADVAWWIDCRLTQSQASQIFRGKSPLLVERANLVDFWPLYGTSSAYEGSLASSRSAITFSGTSLDVQPPRSFPVPRQKFPIVVGSAITPMAFSAKVTAGAKTHSSPLASAKISAKVKAQAEAHTGSAAAASLNARIQAQAKVRPGSKSAASLLARVGALAKGKFGALFFVPVQARITAMAKAMQAVPPVFSSSGLWRTDVSPDANSTYVEAKEPMTWIYETVLLPDNLVMAMNAINESNISFAFLGSSPVVTVTANDTNGQSFDTVTVSAPGTNTLWNQFKWNQAPWDGTGTNLSPWRLPWTEPIVFKQMSITATGISAPGFKIGNLYMRYQILGYRQQRQSGVR